MNPNHQDYAEAFSGLPLPTLTEEDLEAMNEADRDGRLFNVRAHAPDNRYRQLLWELQRAINRGGA